MGFVPDSQDDKHDGMDDQTSDSEIFARDGARARPITESALRPASRDALGKTLLASARHELRSPLQSIQGFAELLGSESYGPLNEEQQSFVEHIVQGSLELGSTMEACLELAELELFAGQRELALCDLCGVLSAAIDEACRSAGTAVQTRFGTHLQTARVRVDRESLPRALQTLLTGLATGPSKMFRASIELEGEQARLIFNVPSRATVTALLSIEEYARRRRATRSLIWLRLSSLLLAQQEATLLVTEQLDCAEVRIRLSSTH